MRSWSSCSDSCSDLVESKDEVESAVEVESEECDEDCATKFIENRHSNPIVINTKNDHAFAFLIFTTTEAFMLIPPYGWNSAIFFILLKESSKN